MASKWEPEYVKTDWIDQKCFLPISYFIDGKQKVIAHIHHIFGNKNHLLRQRLKGA